jgi:hypothetical protein
MKNLNKHGINTQSRNDLDIFYGLYTVLESLLRVEHMKDLLFQSCRYVCYTSVNHFPIIGTSL